MTEFEKKVYRVVMRIPLGEVRTYQWVARQAGYPKAARAVGQAMKKNPWPLLVPCHRVVASGGALGGYAWGVKAKRTLLDLERQIIQSML
jgi:methylated-DNA-[protein]-cysteine S-methyltransferase